MDQGRGCSEREHRAMIRAEQPIKLFFSVPHACPYLSGEEATTLVIDPDLAVNAALLSKLTRTGFRRSGDMIYRPHCARCQACVSVRVSTKYFTPTRSQRRVRHRNRDLRVVQELAGFKSEHFELYLRYQAHRHPDSSMCDPDPEKYESFLISGRAHTLFYTMYLADQLVGVAVADQLTDGLSAVYTFFEPSHAKRSLGTYAILWQIEQAKRQQLDWVYLGYWIRQSQKMSYKAQFRPLQGYIDNRWQILSD